MKVKILNIVVGVFMAGVMVGTLRAENKTELNIGLGAYGGEYWGVFTLFAGVTGHFANDRVLLYANTGVNFRNIQDYRLSNGVGMYFDGGAKFIIVKSKYVEPYINTSIDLMKATVYGTYNASDYIDIGSIVFNFDVGLRIHFVEAFGIEFRTGPHFGIEAYAGEVDNEPVADAGYGFGYHVKGNLFYIF